MRYSNYSKWANSYYLVNFIKPVSLEIYTCKFAENVISLAVELKNILSNIRGQFYGGHTNRYVSKHSVRMVRIFHEDPDPNTLSGWSGFFMRIRIQKLSKEGPDFSWGSGSKHSVRMVRIFHEDPDPKTLSGWSGFFYFLCIHNYVLKGWRNFVHD